MWSVVSVGSIFPKLRSCSALHKRQFCKRYTDSIKLSGRSNNKINFRQKIWAKREKRFDCIDISIEWWQTNTGSAWWWESSAVHTKHTYVCAKERRLLWCKAEVRSVLQGTCAQSVIPVWYCHSYNQDSIEAYTQQFNWKQSTSLLFSECQNQSKSCLEVNCEWSRQKESYQKHPIQSNTFTTIQLIHPY